MIDANRTEKEAFIMLEQLGKQAKEASIILGKAGIEDKIGRASCRERVSSPV